MCGDAPSFEKIRLDIGEPFPRNRANPKKKDGGEVAAGVAEAVVQKERISTEKQRKT